MKKSTYAEKMQEVFDCEQFRKLEKFFDNIVLKNEKTTKQRTFGYEEKGEDTG